MGLDDDDAGGGVAPYVLCMQVYAMCSRGDARRRDSIRLPWGTDGTGLVMGREQGFRGVGRGGLEPDKRLRQGSRARLG